MSDLRDLVSVDSPISLRTAMVTDDGNVVSLILMPRHLDSSVPGLHEHVRWESVALYRRDTSIVKRIFGSCLGATAELALQHSLPQPSERRLKHWLGYAAFRKRLIAQNSAVVPKRFDRPPAFQFIWAHEGHSVAVFINDEPWAFIHSRKNRGFSKGLLNSSIGNLWDQHLFEQTFIHEAE